MLMMNVGFQKQMAPNPKCLNRKDQSEGVLVGPIGVLRGVGSISNSGKYTSLALQREKIQGRRTCIFDLIFGQRCFSRQ